MAVKDVFPRTHGYRHEAGQCFGLNVLVGFANNKANAGHPNPDFTEGNGAGRPTARHNRSEIRNRVDCRVNLSRYIEGSKRAQVDTHECHLFPTQPGLLEKPIHKRRGCGPGRKSDTFLSEILWQLDAGVATNYHPVVAGAHEASDGD